MSVVLILAAIVALANAYGNGPPLSACGDMYPEGHGVNAQTTASIASISAKTSTGLVATKYTAGQVITVTVETANTTDTTIYYEGLFVQARSVNCSRMTPVGTFTHTPSEFLKTLSCSSIANSAISHKDHIHQTTQTFNWTAPATAQGHVFFQATVLRNEKTFWTGVQSAFLRDESDTTAAAYCTVRKLVGGASVAAAMSSLALVAIAFTAFFAF